MGKARQMRKKYIFLNENMLNEDNIVIFEADVAYLVENNLIGNQGGVRISTEDIWVDHRIEFEPEAEEI